MLTIPQLPKKCQGIAWKLKEFCDKHGIQYAFAKSNGAGHPNITIWYDGEKRKLAFSSSPSDHRAGQNAVRQLKQKLIELGWSPAQRELDIGEKKVTTENAFKNQKETLGAASPVVSIDPKIVSGVAIPVKGRSTVDERNEALLQAHEAGATYEAIATAAQAAGWRMEARSVSPTFSKARNVREGLPATTPRTARRKGQGPNSAPTQELGTTAPVFRHPKAASGAGAVDIALEIAEAIAPVIRKHLEGQSAELAELREKAKKFDDLKNLIGGE